MTRFERAAQIWPLLTLCASHRMSMTYDLLGRLIGVPRQSLGQLLEPIQSHCVLNKMPPLTALVVSERTGTPGDGFIAATDLPLAFVEIFAWDWLSGFPPRPDELKSAAEALPTNGRPLAELVTQAQSRIAPEGTFDGRVVVFRNDEQGYRHWIERNQRGFVVNVDEESRTPQYPMVHAATHRLMSSDALENYTTGRYSKACSNDLGALESWSQSTHGRKLTPCSVCMPGA